MWWRGTIKTKPSTKPKVSSEDTKSTKTYNELKDRVKRLKRAYNQEPNEDTEDRYLLTKDELDKFK